MQGLPLELAAARLAHTDAERELAVAHGRVWAETVATGKHFAVAIRKEREQSDELAGALVSDQRVQGVGECGVGDAIAKRSALRGRWLVE